MLTFTVLPLAVLLVVIAFGSLALHQRAMRTLVGERDERAVRAAAAAIAEQLNHRAAAVRSLALQASTSSTPEHALADASFFLPAFEGGLALYEADGQLLAASNNPHLWEEGTISQELFGIDNESVGSDNVDFLGPFRNPETDEELMLVAAHGLDGLTAVGAFRPATLARQALADVFGTTDQTSAFVVSQDGSLLYQVGQLPQAGDQLAQHPGVAKALQGNSGTTYLETEEGEHVIAFSHIPSIGWALVLEEPWRIAADPLLHATELAPLVLVPVVVIALVGLWLGVRQIVQPLQSLAQKATELAWGDFRAIEEPVGGIKEIQRLQSELIYMAQKVQLAQASLRGYLGAMTAGQEEERRRLARDLHDDTIQSLIALNQRIQLAQLSASDKSTLTQLDETQQLAEQIIADLRRLTRDLRPIYLEDLGLVPALDMLARDTSKMLGIPVTFQVSGEERRLRPEIELALYRTAQEALSNVARHAQATCAMVTMSFAGDTITLSVKDNGCGFVAPESPAEMASTGHFGLLGIQERAELIGARMNVLSASDEGTELSIILSDNKRTDEHG